MKKESYRQAVTRATRAAARDRQNYFVYEVRDDYGYGKHWDIVGERFYNECPTIPESWVKAYVGPQGVIEAY